MECTSQGFLDFVAQSYLMLLFSMDKPVWHKVSLFCFDLVHLHHILIVSCTLHSDLCPNRQLSSSCPLCQSSHCIALSCIVLSLMAIFYCTALHQLVLHHCVNLYPDKSPLCPWRPAPCLWRKQLSALIIQEKPHPDLIDPNPCCVTEHSYFGSKLLADLGLLLVLLWTVWKDVSSKRPWFWFNCD